MKIVRKTDYVIHVITADKTFAIFQPEGEAYSDADISKAVRRKMIRKPQGDE